MKHNFGAYIIIFVVAVLCGTAVLAQNGLDDQGHSNNPHTNPRANACYADGSLANTCITAAQWECGWTLIRFEYGLLNDFPQECADLFPALTSSSQQNPFVSDTAATPEVTPPVDDGCAWNWATQPQVALAQQAQTAVMNVGYVSTITATAYGENCLNHNGEVVYFAAMYTAFDVTVTTNANEYAVMNSIATAIGGLSDIPGPSEPQFTFHFISAGPTLVPTITVTPDWNGHCDWRWARQSAPTLAQQAQAAIGAAGYTATVSAELYGEDCYTRSGQFVYFGAMDTTFNVTVTVDATTDHATVQQAVNTAVRGLSGISTSTVYVNVSFVMANPTVRPTATPHLDIYVGEDTAEAAPATEEPSIEATDEPAIETTPEATAES